MKIIGVNDKYPNGVVLPVKTVRKNNGSISPIQEYDWKDIEKRLTPLISNVLEALV